MPKPMPPSLRLPHGYEFHHLGYATASLVQEKKLFAVIGYDQEGESFSDVVQGIFGCFLVGPGPRVELLENLPGSQTLTPWLNAGIKMYHFAYLVDNIEDAISWARSERARVIVDPVPSVAFAGQRISFVMFRNGLMIEFIENQKNKEIAS